MVIYVNNIKQLKILFIIRIAPIVNYIRIFNKYLNYELK